MPKSTDLLLLIERMYPELSPSARAIANYIQAEPLAVVTQSVAEIAEQTKTSKATVSRFFRQLGFDSHQDARQAQLTLRERGVPIGLQTTQQQHKEQELLNLASTHDAINDDIVDAVALRLIKASRVTIIGYRNAYPMALHLRQQLKQLLKTVRLLPQPGQTIGEDILDIEPDEIVIALGFRRRTRIFQHIIRHLPSANTILITDPSGQIYNREAATVLICHLGQQMPFDSYASAMSLMSRISNAVYANAGEAARKRINAIKDLYSELDELEP